MGIARIINFIRQSDEGLITIPSSVSCSRGPKKAPTLLSGPEVLGLGEKRGRNLIQHEIRDRSATLPQFNLGPSPWG